MPSQNLTFACIFPLFAAITLAGCGAPQESTSNAVSENACGGEGIVISEAWARSAREGQPATAAYLSLCSAEGDDKLISATFSGANATELHITATNEDGTASMNQTPDIALPVGEAVTLKPGGAHIMMIGVNETIAPGDAPILTLEFENADPIEITLEVRDAMGGHH